MRDSALTRIRRPLDGDAIDVRESANGCLFGIARHDVSLDAVIQSLAVSGPHGRRMVECVMRRREIETVAGGPAADLLGVFRQVESAVHRCLLAKLARAQFVESAFPRLQLEVTAIEVTQHGAAKPKAVANGAPHVTARVQDEAAPWRKAVPANWRYLRALGSVSD